MTENLSKLIDQLEQILINSIFKNMYSWDNFNQSVNRLNIPIGELLHFHILPMGQQASWEEIVLPTTREIKFHFRTQEIEIEYGHTMREPARWSSKNYMVSFESILRSKSLLIPFKDFINNYCNDSDLEEKIQKAILKLI